MSEPKYIPRPGARPILLRDVYDMLPHLSPEHLRDVAARALVLSDGGEPNSETPTEASPHRAAQALWDALRDEAVRLGCRLAPRRFWGGGPWRRLGDAAEDVDAWARRVLPSDLEGARDLAARCLLTDLIEKGVPLAPVPIANNAHRGPALVEAAFPSYAARGLLGLVVDQMRARGVLGG